MCASMCSGPTSARKPRRPRLIPSSGTLRPAMRRAAYSMLPSPPMATTRSTPTASRSSATRFARAGSERARTALLTFTLHPTWSRCVRQDPHRFQGAGVAGIAHQRDRGKLSGARFLVHFALLIMTLTLSTADC